MDIVPVKNVIYETNCLNSIRQKSIKDSKTTFYSIYDKINLTMQEAWKRVKRNAGAAGIDKITVKTFEANLSKNISSIKTDIRNKNYKVKPARRKWISKSNGKRRGLAIATIRDRTVATALGLLLEAIFEPHFIPNSFAYRPGFSQHSATAEVCRFRVEITWTKKPDKRRKIAEGKRNAIYAIEADLSAFFDNIDWTLLMENIKRKVKDKSFLKLLNKFIKQPVVDYETRGRKRKPVGKGITEYRSCGVPQGAPLSPVLSNIYLHDFDCWMQGWMKYPENEGVCNYVRYADDFLVLFNIRDKNYIKEIFEVIDAVLKKYKVTLNLSKTKISRLLDPKTDSWKFLGYIIRPVNPTWNSWRKHLPYLRVDKDNVLGLKRKIREITARKKTVPLETTVKQLNSVVGGHIRYFAPGYTPGFIRDLQQWIVSRCTTQQMGRIARARTKDRHGFTAQKVFDAGLIDFNRLAQQIKAEFNDLLRVRMHLQKKFRLERSYTKHNNRALWLHGGVKIPPPKPNPQKKLSYFRKRIDKDNSSPNHIERKLHLTRHNDDEHSFPDNDTFNYDADDEDQWF